MGGTSYLIAKAADSESKEGSIQDKFQKRVPKK
jgi:hypothetical protein